MTAGPTSELPAAATHLLPSTEDALALLASADTGLLVIQQGLVVYANPMLARMVGWEAEELPGRSILELAPSLTPDVTTPVLVGMRLPCMRRDGSRFDGFAHLRPIVFQGLPATLLTLSDTIELDAALSVADMNADLLERTESLCHAGSFELYLPSGAVLPSNGLRQLINAPPNEVVYRIDELPWVPPEEQPLVAGFWRQARPGESFEFEHRIQCSDGRRLTVLHRGMLYQPTADAPEQRGLALLQDITAQRDAERRVQELATRDNATGLPNRAAFLDELDASLHAARWTGGTVSVLTIEVPRLAEIQDTMGYVAAGRLTRSLGQRLLGRLVEGESAALLGEAEFGVLLALDLRTDVQRLREHVLARADALRSLLEEPLFIDGTEVYPRCVIGAASFPIDTEEPSLLLERAQAARLNTTQAGPVAFFAAETHTRALREMQLESHLRHALRLGELTLRYQPQVDLSDGRVVGAEALLRWTSPDLGEISPEEFIPVAEQSGLIGALGDWVLREVCQQTVAWRRAGLRPLRVGINLSATQLAQPDLVQHVQTVLLQTGADPAALGVELTESTAMADVAQAGAVLRELKALGLEISLDDFGTGHSSLSCLRSLPVDVVKVDRSFVHDVTASPQDVSVTRAIITMAHGLQMQVLAEGVETEGQLALLSAHRCDRFQGFWFSQAVTADEVAAMVADNKRVPERFITRVRRQRTLLLVDDEAHILSALKRLFRRDGYHLITACGAEEGLQRLAETEVDVILSDQRMPGMTGVELLRRAKDLYPDSIRMVLSGYTELQSIIDAVNEGAIYRFLTKPWDDERLRQHVAEAFRRRELDAENRRLLQQIESANADYLAVNARLERLLEQQRQQAELLGSSAGNLHQLLHRLPVCVLGLEEDDTIVFANEVALDLLTPLCPGGVVGRSCTEVLPGLDAGAQAHEVNLGNQRFKLLRRKHGADGPASHGSELLMILPATGEP